MDKVEAKSNIYQIDNKNGHICYGVYQYAFDVLYICVMIHSLYVNKLERGKGIGRKLLSEAAIRAKMKWPELKIKIVAEPTEPEIEKKRLIKFYNSIKEIDEVIK